MKRKFYYGKGLCFLLLIFTLQTSCKKLVEVDAPPTSTNDYIVFGNDGDATAAVTNLYMRMSQSSINDPSNLRSLAFYTGLSADELQLSPTNTNPGQLAHYQNSLSTTIAGIADYWTNTYSMIFICNAAIEGITASSTLTPAIKQQLLGEVRFMRAFYYFHLVNIYGEVPLNLTTDYKANAVRPRTNKDIVYQQIIADLKEAQNLLSEEYRSAGYGIMEERTKPNKAAATALLARVYLYINDNQNAEAEATLVINRKPVYDVVRVDSVFLKNNKETIWALQPILLNYNTSEASIFLASAGINEANPLVHFSRYTSDKLSAVDLRKINWVDSLTISGSKLYYSKKYKNQSLPGDGVTEYPIIMRLAEQYLIRAEARAKQGRLTGANSAESDLNIIRSRAGLPGTMATSSEDAMVNAILEERQRELFLEWGHRWFDLKRTGKANSILGAIKGANWQPKDQLYPIPQNEIDGNPGLNGQQNP